jgi:zinc transport system substrate-binding protein
MKKISSLLLAVVVVAALLAACGKTPHAQNANDDRISVVSTIFAPYDFVRAIAGDHVNLTMLLPPGSESHSYEPTPQDILTVQNCDVFIYIGGESDAWIGDILASLDTSGFKIVTLMDCVEVVEEEIVEGMQEDEDDHEENAAYDEHVWTSPQNAGRIVEKLTATLCEVDEDNKAAYETNKTAYLAKLSELDAAFQNVVENAARKEIIFGDRFPFRYFADAYGLTYYAAFPGCATETEASAATVAFLIDKVEQDSIPAVFHIELSSKKMANAIAESVADRTEREVKVLLLHACHNVSRADFESGATYLSLMEGNVQTLKEALS